MAEVHLDFMFMGDEGDDRTLAVLVVTMRDEGQDFFGAPVSVTGAGGAGVTRIAN